MSDILIISNVENYNKTFEFTDTKTYVLRYVELINEYMLYVVENMIIQDDTYLLFLIRRGVETIMHCFKFLLMYTKNLELTVYQCKKALYYYIEFIGQISDVSLHHSYLQLNSKDSFSEQEDYLPFSNSLLEALNLASPLKIDKAIKGFSDISDYRYKFF